MSFGGASANILLEGMIDRSQVSEIAPENLIWEAVDQFEAVLRENRAAAIGDFLPARDDPAYAMVLAELLRIKLEFQWSQGAPPDLNSLFDEVADARDFHEVVDGVAFEDFRQHKLHGRQVNPDDYRRSFGVDSSNWLATWEMTQSQIANRSQDRQIAAAHATTSARSLDTDAPARPERDRGVLRPQFPKVGTTWGQFVIIRELGRGAFSRVYAARQVDLAQRIVAVKITTVPMGESQRLAKMQHAHVMPLYSIHQHEILYGLCMPLLGAVTIKDLVERLSQADTQRTKVDVWNELSKQNIQFQTEFELTSESSLPESTADFNTRVLHLAQRLAEGLAHAHARGILHRDIKPANVLLAWDGQPLLMDFNLSRETTVPKALGGPAIGGTWAYMAPEQVRAMWRGDGELTAAADIFSLGVVLFELLTGRLPYSVDWSPAVEGEQAISARHLAPEMDRVLSVCVSPTVAAIIRKCLAFDPEQRYHSAQALAEDISLHLQFRPVKYAGNPSWAERAGKFLQRHPSWRGYSGLSIASLLIATILSGLLWQFFSSHRRHLAHQAFAAFQHDLHRSEARLFLTDGGSSQAGIELGYRALEHFNIDTDANWERRSLFPWLPTAAQNEVRQQSALLLSILRQFHEEPGGAQTDDPNFREVPFAFIESTESGLVEATRLYRQRKYRDAIPIVKQQLERFPQRFALWFLLGQCYFELREYRLAETYFSQCCLIDDQSATAFFARGLCHYWMLHDREALTMFARAIELDADYAAARVNQALVYERQRQFSPALVAIESALEMQPNTTRYLMIRSRIKRGLGDDVGADHDLMAVKSIEPKTPDDWIMRGIARLNDSPEEALDDFRQAVPWRSTATTARQNMAHVLSERLGRLDEAIETLTELLRVEPEFAPALTGRAVLYARLGKRDEALADVERCLLLENTPALNYQIGCVYSLLSTHEPELADRAIQYLSRALQPAYGGGIIGHDADLKPLERNAVFRRMKIGVQTIMEQSQ